MANAATAPGPRRPHVVVLAVHHICQGGLNLRGGAEKYARATVEALLSAGADVTVNYSGDSIYDGLRANEAGQRFAIERTDWLGPDLRADRPVSPRLVGRRVEWFAARRPDVVFVVQQDHGQAFAASLYAARLVAPRVAMSIRQMAPAPPRPGGKRWFGVIPSFQFWRRRLRWRAMLAARCCDLIIFNSEIVRSAFVRDWGYPARRCRVIPNGVDAPIDVRRAAGHPALTFACVGQIAEHKGSDLAMTALADLARDSQRVRLVYFGDGPWADDLRRAANQAGLPIEVAGHVADRDALFTGIDVLLAPSRRESSSNAVIEAMVRGIPCVVSDAGGLPELIRDGETGFIVPSGDAAALSNAMRRLAGAPDLRARLGAAARRIALERHDMRRRSAETIAAILGPCAAALAGAPSSDVDGARHPTGRISATAVR